MWIGAGFQCDVDDLVHLRHITRNTDELVAVWPDRRFELRRLREALGNSE
jgi:hypothetical protein